jgi:hypothetical protein
VTKDGNNWALCGSADTKTQTILLGCECGELGLLKIKFDVIEEKII